MYTYQGIQGGIYQGGIPTHHTQGGIYERFTPQGGPATVCAQGVHASLLPCVYPACTYERNLCAERVPFSLGKRRGFCAEFSSLP